MNEDQDLAPKSLTGDDLYTVEGSVRTHVQKLHDIRENMKKLNEMLRSYLEGDEEFVTATKAAKEASAKKSAVKQRLMSAPGAQGIPQKIEELREEKRKFEEGLSYYLTEFQRMTGTSEFEDENGELKKIVYVAKLVSTKRDK